MIPALKRIPALLETISTLLETMEVNGSIPATLSHRAWWQAFVMAHQVWLLLLLSLLLLYEMFAYRRSSNLKDRTVSGTR